MHPVEKPKQMRFFPLLLLTLFTLSSSAQNYGGWWQEVDDFTRDGRPKSALEVVQKIHDQAVKDGNGPQLVKAVIHEIKFQAQFEEESLVASIIRLEDEAKPLPDQPSRFCTRCWQKCIGVTTETTNGRFTTERPRKMLATIF